MNGRWLVMLNSNPADQSHHRAEDTIIAILVMFVGYLIFRGAAEGLIDSYRASNGLGSKADIGQ